MLVHIISVSSSTTTTDLMATWRSSQTFGRPWNQATHDCWSTSASFRSRHHPDSWRLRVWVWWVLRGGKDAEGSIESCLRRRVWRSADSLTRGCGHCVCHWCCNCLTVNLWLWIVFGFLYFELIFPWFLGVSLVIRVCWTGWGKEQEPWWWSVGWLLTKYRASTQLPSTCRSPFIHRSFWHIQ